MPEPVHKAGEIARRSAAAAGKPCNTVIKTAATARELAQRGAAITSAAKRSLWVAKTSRLTARLPRMKPKSAVK
jgi:hypothetical protein